MEPYQERVVEEKKELALKIDKLANFMNGPGFNQVLQMEQHRMRVQHAAMMTYLLALAARIAAFS